MDSRQDTAVPVLPSFRMGDSGVVVVGMHRSGTSALTRVLNLLGVPVSPTRFLAGASRSNPTGHWENTALLSLNEDLLRLAGGSWSIPPDLPPSWPQLPKFRNVRPDAARLFDRTMPSTHWLWKDPRICITLPFWRVLLGSRLFMVLINRNPIEIAYSLNRRGGITVPTGLMLWEYYVGSALKVIEHLPTMVVTYDDLVRDPIQIAASLRSWLEDMGFPGLNPVLPQSAIEGFVDRGLWRERAGEDSPNSHLTTSQRELLTLVDGLKGGHSAFPALEPPEPSRCARWLLEERRAWLPVRNQLSTFRARTIKGQMRRVRNWYRNTGRVRKGDRGIFD